MQSSPKPDPPKAFACFESVAGRLDAGALVICDHASNALPAEYGDLGLGGEAMRRHIAFDIGAALLTRRLAQALGAPAILSTFSRLLIDPNRGADDPTLVMRLSDGAAIPGNAGVDDAARARRLALYWQPYRRAIGDALDAMIARGPPPVVLSIHSFTPIWRGTARPWQIGLLWDRDPRVVEPLLAALRAEPDMGPGAVGDNEPYDGALEGDMIDAAATSRGLANVLIEVRQDLIADNAGAIAWADRLARLVKPILAAGPYAISRQYGSRAADKAVRRGELRG